MKNNGKIPTDEQIVASAKARMVIDRMHKRETPDWIVAVALAGVPVNHQKMYSDREVWEKKQKA
jgi:hypothetical protein